MRKREVRYVKCAGAGVVAARAYLVSSVPGDRWGEYDDRQRFGRTQDAGPRPGAAERRRLSRPLS